MVKLESLDDLPSLREALELEAQRAMEVYPQDVMDIVLDSIKNLASSELMDIALRTGDVFPHFALPDINGTLVDSTDLLAKGPIVITFIRGGWCGYCNITMRMIRKYVPHFEARGATVVAISPDTIDRSQNLAKEGGLTFPILSDSQSELAQECNIAYELSDGLKAILGPTVAGYQGNDSLVVPIPATYVINTDGKVIYSFVEADFTKRAEPLDIIKALPKLKRDNRRYLKERLDIELAKFRDTVPEKTMAELFEQIHALEDTGIAASAMQKGDVAPKKWSLPNVEGKIIHSKKLLKDADFLIVVFYRGVWCPFNSITLAALERFRPQFESKGAKVVAISPQSVKYSATTASQNAITFPLLSDVGNHVASSFRLVHTIDNDDLLCSQRNLREFNEDDSRTLPLPAVYVIDRDGTILFSDVSCDFTKGPEPLEILAAIPPQKEHYKKRTRGPFSLNFKNWLPRNNKQPRSCGTTNSEGCDVSSESKQAAVAVAR